jgi:hypothetical protein
MAGRLHDRLAQNRDKLFMDVDHIPVGIDFVAHLNSPVGDYDRAIADFNEAIRLDPKYALDDPIECPSHHSDEAPEHPIERIQEEQEH